MEADHPRFKPKIHNFSKSVVSIDQFLGSKHKPEFRFSDNNFVFFHAKIYLHKIICWNRWRKNLLQ